MRKAGNQTDIPRSDQSAGARKALILILSFVRLLDQFFISRWLNHCKLLRTITHFILMPFFLNLQLMNFVFQFNDDHIFVFNK